MTPLIILEAFGRFATPASTSLEDPPTSEISAGDLRRAFSGYAEPPGLVARSGTRPMEFV